MASFFSLMFVATLAGTFATNDAGARNRAAQDSGQPTSIEESSSTLAPFQHIRFCLRYPADCKSNPMEGERIELNAENSELLKRVNRNVNMSIAPRLKSYGTNLEDEWTIAPDRGDCNDYAVTKRHELLESGLPSKALRLSVVTTAAGIGHLVLVVATTRGDLVMDNLTEAIRPWQSTNYHWLKIQSAADARFWHEVKARASGVSVSRNEQRVRLASHLTD
jgi:predicted transglutaminase-like cysteine proteinase